MKCVYGTVPRLYPGGTIACLASGPSLTKADADSVRDVDEVIVINTTYQLAPWAGVLYAADARWWSWHGGAPSFRGLKYTLTPDPRLQTWGVTLLKNTGNEGLELSPDGLRTGRNSGYQAINLAVHLGATRILLLGYDMQPGPGGRKNWHGNHKNPHGRLGSDYPGFRKKFETLVQPLQVAGVEVINCSRSTALMCFPRLSLAEALAGVAA